MRNPKTFKIKIVDIFSKIQKQPFGEGPISAFSGSYEEFKSEFKHHGLGNYVYVLQVNNLKYKVGKTTDIKTRIKAHVSNLKAYAGEKFENIKVFGPLGDTGHKEKELRTYFESFGGKVLSSDWFGFDTPPDFNFDFLKTNDLVHHYWNTKYFGDFMQGIISQFPDSGSKHFYISFESLEKAWEASDSTKTNQFSSFKYLMKMFAFDNWFSLLDPEYVRIPRKLPIAGLPSTEEYFCLEFD